MVQKLKNRELNLAIILMGIVAIGVISIVIAVQRLPSASAQVSTGTINTASNLGTGEGFFSTELAADAQFKSLTVGSGLVLSSSANEVNINIPSIEGVIIGASSPAAATFTDVISTTWNIGTIEGTSLGDVTPADGTFVNLTANTTLVVDAPVSGTSFLDEDDLTTDSATALASQQSIKAYVDSVSTFAISTSDSVITTDDVLGDENLPGVAVAANTKYIIKGQFQWLITGAGTSLRIGFSCPAGVTLQIVGVNDSGTREHQSACATKIGNFFTSADRRGSAFEGYLEVAGTAGTLQMQMAQNASHGDTHTIYEGAYLEITEVG